MVDFKPLMTRLLKSAYYEGYCDNGGASIESLRESYGDSAAAQLNLFLERLTCREFKVDKLSIADREFLYALLDDTAAMIIEEELEDTMPEEVM